MFTITDAADLTFIITSIYNGSAVSLSDHNFNDSDMTGSDYDIRFYSLADAVFRTSRNSRTTITTIHEITDDYARDRLLAVVA